jgi:alkylated DNA repair dioxygenase AlkB
MEGLRQFDLIKGLYYAEDVLTPKEESDLIELINEQDWMADLSRRVQHYGYKYNYIKRRIDIDDKIEDLPVWTNKLQEKIFELLKKANIVLPFKDFDQLIINEYKKGQGIRAHVDCVPCFTDCIVSVTLGNSGIMTFRNGENEHDIKLSPRSIVVLTDESRYKWTHEIDPSKNKNFTVDKPRISLTFRRCILRNKK